jgi:DNA topoisomerase I
MGACGQPRHRGGHVELGKNAATQAGLRYVRDDGPGIRRTGSHPRFRYVDGAGRPVHDPATLARIRALVIPPAWTSVWICPSGSGHIQATGRDARGRKQYRYHASWRLHRDAHKFARMIEFGRALRRLRRTTDRDLARRGLPHEKVLATVVRLLELTHARIGNEQYAKANRSYGLTTLENRHVDVEGGTLRFHFRGKSGKAQVFGVDSPPLARIVRQCEELPGQHLFEYVDEDGVVRPIGSHDVNEYIRANSGGDFSAKDFRTLAGTVLAARALRAQHAQHAKKGISESKAQWKRAVRAALELVAGHLGNTVAVCRKSYVHPAVLQANWISDTRSHGPSSVHGASEEQTVLRFIARVTLSVEEVR